MPKTKGKPQALMGRAKGKLWIQDRLKGKVRAMDGRGSRAMALKPLS